MAVNTPKITTTGQVLDALPFVNHLRPHSSSWCLMQYCSIKLKPRSQVKQQQFSCACKPVKPAAQWCNSTHKPHAAMACCDLQHNPRIPTQDQPTLDLSLRFYLWPCKLQVELQGLLWISQWVYMRNSTKPFSSLLWYRTGLPCRSQELDSMILMGPSQLRSLLLAPLQGKKY